MSASTENELVQNELALKYYTEVEVAKFLDKSVASLRADACRRKSAPRTKIGKRILYKKESFDAWIAKKEIDFSK